MSGRISSGLCFLFWACVSAAEPLDVWHQRYPPVPVDSLNAIAFGDDKFVIVGDRGRIIRFSSTTDWAIQNSGTTNRLLGVCFGNGQWIAVGERGQILVSPDAVTWTAYPVDASLGLRAVTFGGGLFGTVSETGDNRSKILTSSDGITWTPRLTTSSQFVGLNCLAYGQGVFVAGGSPNFYSTNGLEWHEAQVTNVFSFPVQSLSYGKGLFVAHARYSGAVSTNGKDWQGVVMEFARDKHGAAHGGQHYVWVGEGSRLGHSLEGTNWNSGIIADSSSLRGGAYGHGRFITVGDYGSMVYSLDATNWSRVFPGPGYVSGLDFVAGQYVATDAFRGIVHVSSNVVQWETGRPPSPLNQLAGFRGRFVGVGNSGAIGLSADALEWTLISGPVTTNLLAVASSPDSLVAVGDGGTVLSSIDGTNWVTRNSGVTHGLSSIARGDDRFVAVGRLGTVIRSADGVAWRQATVASWRPALSSVAFGKCRFVALSGGDVFVSTNSIDWARAHSVSSLTLYSVAYGNGRFVACGYNSYPFPNSCVLSSSNGVNWRCHALPSYRSYGRAVFGADAFVISVDGLIIQSDPVPVPTGEFLLSARRASDLEITASGLADTCCRLESVPRLGPEEPWQPVDYLILNSNGVARYTETPLTNNPTRFFRAVRIP